jgi:hypothetical protein
VRGFADGIATSSGLMEAKATVSIASSENRPNLLRVSYSGSCYLSNAARVPRCLLCCDVRF